MKHRRNYGYSGGSESICGDSNETPYATVSDARFSTFFDAIEPRRVQAAGDSLTTDELISLIDGREFPYSYRLVGALTFIDTPFRLPTAQITTTSTGNAFFAEIETLSGTMQYEEMLAPFASLIDAYSTSLITVVDGMEIARGENEIALLLDDTFVRLRYPADIAADDVEGVLSQIIAATPDPITGGMRAARFAQIVPALDVSFAPPISFDMFNEVGFVFEVIGSVDAENLRDTMGLDPSIDRAIAYSLLSPSDPDLTITILQMPSPYADVASWMDQGSFLSPLMGIGFGEYRPMNGVEVAAIVLSSAVPPDTHIYVFVDGGLLTVLSAELYEGPTTPEILEDVVSILIEAG